MLDQEKRLVGGWWVWVLVLLVLTSLVMFALNGLGIIGQTVVEREVFERSFQYSEARKTEIATYEAQLAEIEKQLSSDSLTDGERTDLEAQRSAIEIRLRVAKEKAK